MQTSQSELANAEVDLSPSSGEESKIEGKKENVVFTRSKLRSINMKLLKISDLVKELLSLLNSSEKKEPSARTQNIREFFTANWETYSSDTKAILPLYTLIESEESSVDKKDIQFPKKAHKDGYKSVIRKVWNELSRLKSPEAEILKERVKKDKLAKK
jgi:hypothetical protein